MAFIDIDILATCIEKTRSVLEDVVGRLGPSDATVVVQVLGKSEQDEDQTSWARHWLNASDVVGDQVWH
jgi:hypothetical protein